MNVCDRMRSLRISKNMTQKEVANNIGVSEISVRCWENGTKNPSMSAIISLASLFDVSTDFILGVNNENDSALLMTKQESMLLSNYRMLDAHGRKVVDTVCVLEKSRIETMSDIKPNVHQIKKKSPSRYIPRYTTPSAAGTSVPLDGDDFEMILVDDSIPYDADFAVGIQGNSMYPYIHDGDTVYVKKDCELSIGDVGIFCVDGAMYCKQYYIDQDGNLTLVSANPRLKHTNVYISADSSSDVRCYGKVLLGVKVEIPDYIIYD